ncbi:MAG TPA: HEAT repeat domain-containing protein [Chloroflexia bacterium]|nr:HEAT repeat domain-containing protein [Chloroflexia bacterium]
MRGHSIWGSAVLVAALLASLLGACGPDPTASVPPPAATTATTVATVLASPPVAATELPATLAPTPSLAPMDVPALSTDEPPTTAPTRPPVAEATSLPAKTAAPDKPLLPVTAQAGSQPTATTEPDECFLSVGATMNWELRVSDHKAADMPAIVDALQDPCADNRWLAIWALGSIHDPATRPALEAYRAAHPAGDWHGDLFDMVPLAGAALAYLDSPQDATHTYSVRELPLFDKLPRFAGGSEDLDPARMIPAATPLELLERMDTGRTRPDHGGETPVIIERVRVSGEATVYYLDISPYVVSEPRYFEVPGPRP